MQINNFVTHHFHNAAFTCDSNQMLPVLLINQFLKILFSTSFSLLVGRSFSEGG